MINLLCSPQLMTHTLIFQVLFKVGSSGKILSTLSDALLLLCRVGHDYWWRFPSQNPSGIENREEPCYKICQSLIFVPFYDLNKILKVFYLIIIENMYNSQTNKILEFKCFSFNIFPVRFFCIQAAVIDAQIKVVNKLKTPIFMIFFPF